MCQVVTSVVLGILSPGTVKTDDTKSPRTRQALSSGGLAPHCLATFLVFS